MIVPRSARWQRGRSRPHRAMPPAWFGWATCSHRWSAAVIDFSTWCQIRDHLGRQQLTVTQTAQALGLDPRTVAYWSEAQFRPRAHTTPHASKLDPFKGQIVRWLDSHPYSAQQILQRLREIGFDGGRSIVKNYVARIRPRQHPAFLKLDFAPGGSRRSWPSGRTALSRWATPGVA